LFAGGNNPETVRRTVDEAETLRISGVTAAGFPGEQTGDNDMATEGHRYAGRKNPELMSKI
jgi:hypothetical protein